MDNAKFSHISRPQKIYKIHIFILKPLASLELLQNIIKKKSYGNRF